MSNTIVFQKECPITHATPTYVLDRTQLQQMLNAAAAVEVFCTSCAQVHTLDAAERRRISRKLAEQQ